MWGIRLCVTGQAQDYLVNIIANALAVLTTNSISSITVNSAVSGGDISSDGGSTITERGVVYGTATNPTTANTKVADAGGGTGSYTSNLTGLLDNTTYYVRAYAINGGGTSYGNVQTFTTNSVGVPVAADATNVTTNSFTANWGAVPGATGYRLDVSTNNSFSNVIALETFENALSLFSTSLGGIFYSGNSASSGDLPSNSPFAFEGNYGYGITNGNLTITSVPISLINVSNPQLSFKLGSFSIGSTGNGADAGDIVTVEVSPDNGSNYFSTIRVLGNSNAAWGYSATGIASTQYDGNSSPVDFQPNGGGLRTTDGYSTVTITNLPAVSNLKVRITLLNNASAERWIIDDFKILGSNNPFVTGYNDVSVSGTSHPVSGLTSNTSYYYRVRAVTSSSTSANSNTISVSTLVDPAVADFRSRISGNFYDENTWEYNTSGSNYSPATFSPTGDNNILIQAGHVVTLDGSALLNSGKTLTVNGTFNTLDNLFGGGGSVTVQNGGILQVGSTSTSGAITDNISTSGTFTLQTGSTVEFNGSGAQFMAPRSFSNLAISNVSGVTMLGGVTVTGTLSLASGTLSLGSNTLALGGAVTQIAGNLAGTASSVLNLSGSAAQAFGFSGSANNLSLLSINKTGGTATLQTALNIYTGITFSGTGTLNLNAQAVTLKSTASNTAYIGILSGTLTGETNVTVERYLPAKRAWRMLTTPLSNTGSVFANWQNNGTVNGTTGVEIWSSSGSGSGGNGMTNAGETKPSMQTFDPVANNWVNMTNTKTTDISGDRNHSC